MKPEQVKEILEGAGRMKIGVLGDFALDAYWMLEQAVGEFSVETGRQALVVRKQSYSPGGAGNIVANLAALGEGRTSAFGVLGTDLFGSELLRQLEEAGVQTGGLIRQEGSWETPVWAKPHINEEEIERLDFGFYNKLAESTRKKLIQALEQALPELDALIVDQQLPHPLMNQDRMSDVLNRLAARYPEVLYISDYRQEIHACRGMALKFNEYSLMRQHLGLGPDEPLEAAGGYDELVAALESLFGDWDKPILVTRGPKGTIVYESGTATEIPAAFVPGEIDPVGAGDTMLAAFTACLAAGCDTCAAAEIGNWAAAVTVAKLRQTGTASIQEILDQVQGGCLVYCPDLAEDLRFAKYLPDTRIEIVRDELPRGKISHMIFDNDGTISTLRQGWEPIMEQVMLQSVFGPRYDTVSSAEFNKVKQRSAQFIDQTTGIQTIVQMQGLVDLVREFGYVEPEKILDAPGYKEIYNIELLKMVRERLARLEAGELNADDFTMKGAVEFVRTVRRAGITCYMASGTDIGDVKNEAGTLGYADLFDGGIFGSVGDINKFSKRILIAGIIRDFNLEGPQLCSFGDGPVEIRETANAGGLTVGIASDEVRRFGLNSAKRERLIKAGADTVIGDFTQAATLIDYLKIKM
ncbi:MAG: PfkB family carbohydrate kinase [Gemmatimonadota bacterium]|nr:PfkB family carbohydrate kinase [Gemmatimonadota bacterium]